ncbi:MAG: molybdopterin molybdotransferase MoeA, partial [SAR324 cluster bacterium]|nr:molybdopterin molybdotransferase MoeA [SAR324 cluster bacterium]
PSVIAFAASVGKVTLKVSKKIKIAVMSTGTEVIDPAATPKPWQIRDANGPALASWASSMGAQVLFLGRAVDDEDLLSDMISQGLAADILLLSGGVSMGEKDLIPGLLKSLNVKEVFHNVKIKPGKPIWFGKAKNCFVFGLPGNPVSAQAGAKLFVEPLLLAVQGVINPKPNWIQLEMGECFKKRTDREQFVPAKIIDSKLYPVPLRGSGDFSNLAEAQGMFQVPADIFELETGTAVNFMFWRQL